MPLCYVISLSSSSSSITPDCTQPTFLSAQIGILESCTLVGSWLFLDAICCHFSIYSPLANCGAKHFLRETHISHASGAPHLCLSYFTEWIDGCPCDQTILHLYYRQTVQKTGLSSLGFHLHCLLRANTQPQIRKRTLFTNSMENNAYVDSCQPVHRISGYVGFYEILSTALPD